MLRDIGNTLSLVVSSLMNRRGTAMLTIASIAVSVALLSGVDRLRTDAQTSFANTISGTDLIIGARSGDLNLLLYSVFRIGNPTNNISWDSYELIGSHPEVAWTIPISLGDAPVAIGYSARIPATSITIALLISARWSLRAACRSPRQPMRLLALRSLSNLAMKWVVRLWFRMALRKPVF